MLFVDAALPAPPRTRPLLVVGCAAAIVVALVVLVGPSRRDLRFPVGPWGSPDQKQPSDPLPDQSGKPLPAGPLVENGGGPKPEPVDPVAEEPVAVAVSDWKDLARLAQDTAAAPEKSYRITVKQDLWRDAEDSMPEVVLRGKSITLIGEEPGRTIWSRYVADSGRVGGLVLEAETVQLRWLRVVADANSNGPGQLGAAGVFVRAKQGGTLKSATFTECEFLQGNWSRSPESPPTTRSRLWRPAAPRRRSASTAAASSAARKSSALPRRGWAPTAG